MPMPASTCTTPRAVTRCPAVPPPRRIAAGVLEIDTHARRLGAGDGRLPDRGPRTRARRDRKPDLGARAAGRAGPDRGRARPSWPGSLSRTSTSTTPAASATWPVPSRRPPCTCTRRGRGTWPTRPGSSTRRRASTGRCSTPSTAASTRRRPSVSTCSTTGRRLQVGPDRTLVAVDSPGHAKHHVGLHDSLSGVLFAGDAVGVKLPDGGVLRPSTPPPDFDLDLAITSLRQVRGAPAVGHRAGSLRAARAARGAPGRGRGDAAAVGRDGGEGLPRGV